MISFFLDITMTLVLIVVVSVALGWHFSNPGSTSSKSSLKQEYQTDKNAYEESQSPIKETSHEGHSPYGMYSKNHEDRVGRMLVKHPEPTPGYVVLNGVKISLKDCKNL